MNVSWSGASSCLSALNVMPSIESVRGHGTSEMVGFFGNRCHWYGTCLTYEGLYLRCIFSTSAFTIAVLFFW